jgi:hypothetical protein
MTNNTESDPKSEQRIDQNDVTAAAAASSTYKILGEFADADGAGVLGKNTAASGTPIGVEGAVPNTSGGYGLSTPDDAKVEGTAELATVDTTSDDFTVAAGNTSTNDATNVVLGHESNDVIDGATGATIAGGGYDSGSTAERNVVSDNYGTVGGGFNNQAGSTDTDPASARFSTVSGGRDNTASDSRSTVSGGENNTAAGYRATIGGGGSNDIIGTLSNATISGGFNNTIDGATDSFIGGGISNSVTDGVGSIGGGWDNTIAGLFAHIGGGRLNDASADYATIAGGGPSDTTDSTTRNDTKNVVVDEYGTIGGGGNNQAGSSDGDSTSTPFATVSGGENNTASGDHTTIGGGLNNTAGSWNATVSGGKENVASSNNATIAGGRENTADRTGAAVGGGKLNSATGADSVVAGGSENKATATHAAVPGGSTNTADGGDSLAAGRRAHAANDSTFIWSDGTEHHDVPRVDILDGFASDQQVGTTDPVGANTFNVSASGGVRFVTGTSTVAYLDPDDATWNTTSTRSAKTNVEPVDPQSMLAGVTDLDVSAWEYQNEDGEGTGKTHVGPMAEDFHGAFDVGRDEHEDTINSIDRNGVALAAIQGLSEKLEQKTERIEELERANENLEERLTHIEAQLDSSQRASADD